MKIVLASYFEQDNHGEGRKIGVSPGKPDTIDYECEFQFEPFSPGDLYWDYHKNKRDDYEGAGKAFVEGYRAQLEEFVEELTSEAESQGKTPIDILPFEDGDTLLTWEKKGNTSYRSMLADYLRDIGYDVEEN